MRRIAYEIVEHINVTIANAGQDMIIEDENKTPVNYAKPMIKFAQIPNLKIHGEL